MGLLVVENDFEGKWDLAKSNDDKLSEYIDLYEERYLIDCLGKELYDLFAATVVSGTHVPVGAIYLNIFNPFTETISNYTYYSEGLKKMLLGFIYFHYVRDNKTKQSMNGAVEQQTEVSVKSDNTFLYLRYNDAIKTYRSIQTYIFNNLSTYPEFNGVAKFKASFA